MSKNNVVLIQGTEESVVLRTMMIRLDQLKNTGFTLSVISLAIACLSTAVSGADLAKGFDRNLSLQGINFHVQATGGSSINQLTITPSGLEVVNLPLRHEVDGIVTDAEVADLDNNGWPEIYVYITSAGSGSYGSLSAYAVNNGKSMSAIYLPPLSRPNKAAAGYMGHDEFAVVENVLSRRFPLYSQGDVQSKPTGGIRQLEYRLEAGEAGWKLRLDKVTDF